MAQRIALILAGGVGERFWPLSRRDRPKQLLPLGPDGRTLLADTVERIRPFFPTDSVYVVTGRPLQETIRAADLLHSSHILAEPAKRNTAGALVFAVARLLADMGEEAHGVTLAVLPADHRIGPATAFREDLERALQTVERHGGLAVIGIPPKRPETGYGYIEVAEDAEANGAGAFPVAAFREKPDAGTAQAYAASGRHFWNSGMFFWRLGDFMDELQTASPVHHAAIAPLAAVLAEDDPARADALFEDLPDLSIDYALMEKAERVWMVPASFGWDDLGAWDALLRMGEKDTTGNVVLGDAILVDTHDSVVVNDAPAGEGTVAVIGLDGVVVVVTDDAVLVVPADRAQEVREVVDRLKGSGNLLL